jgi:hypothetical protein
LWSELEDELRRVEREREIPRKALAALSRHKEFRWLPPAPHFEVSQAGYYARLSEGRIGASPTRPPADALHLSQLLALQTPLRRSADRLLHEQCPRGHRGNEAGIPRLQEASLPDPD